MLLNKNNQGDEEISTLAPWTGVFSFRSLSEAVIEATDWLQETIGEDTVAFLDSFYNSARYEPTEDRTPSETIIIEAIQYTQRTLLNDAFLKYIAKGAVHFENSGISVKFSEEWRPAREEIYPLRKSLNNSALLFLSKLIKLFDKNPNIFTTWGLDKANKQHNNLLIRTAYDFSNRYFIENSHGFYHSVTDKQLRVQREKVAPAAGAYYPQLLLLAQNSQAVATAHTVATTAELPASSTELYLVSDLGQFWQYSTSWAPFVLDLRPELDLACQIVAEGTIALKAGNDYNELREYGDNKAGRLEGQLLLIQEMKNSQTRIADALTNQLRDMIEARDYVPDPIIEQPASGSAYLPIAGTNSIML